MEEAVQKWQKCAQKAQRHADACYSEAQAKEEEAAEASSQVHIAAAAVVVVFVNTTDVDAAYK